MIPRWKKIIRDVLPPALMRVLTASRRSGFSGSYSSWDEAQRASTGYDSDSILDRVKGALLKVKSGEAVFERDSVLFDKVQYSWPLLAGLLWAASRNDNRLNVLDFGGSLGSSYFQNLRLLGHLRELRWNIVEQPNFVAEGKRTFESPELRFYENVDLCLQENQADVLVLGSVLQYLERPYEVLGSLLQRNFDVVIVDRTPFVREGGDRITIQKVPREIYEASYPAWFFDEGKFRHFIADRYDVVSDFVSGVDAETPFGIFKGFLLLRKGAA